MYIDKLDAQKNFTEMMPRCRNCRYEKGRVVFIINFSEMPLNVKQLACEEVK
jgi:hypothetical protein